jgi:CPA1 family monovalent cation:H+ antiporter
MTSTIQILVSLLVVTAAIGVAARRFDLPPAILLVVAGIVLALIPGLPNVELAPEFVLLVILPPLVYDAAVAMSWREFRFNLRPIALLAIGCVLFTTAIVAVAVHYLLGFPWPVGFALGAIVSPPDPVAPVSIARRMQIPRRIMVVLEGEGLANDATALIVYRFAVVATSLGSFSLGNAAAAFCAILVGEILWGIGVGWLMLRIRRWVRDPRIEITLSILTPFLAYWPPEALGGSGVLATVATGLYISWNGLRLISAATRLQGVFFWDFVIYVIEGLVFLITGLQARSLLHGMSGHTAKELVLAALLVSAAVIVTRFVWVFPAVYLPRWLIPSIREKDPAPPWQWAFILGFTGIRGVVSLAAALAIPLTITSREPFPHRDMIIFLTFIVILLTLVGQGLMMSRVVRWLGLAHAGRRERRADREEEAQAWLKASEAALGKLQEIAAERGLAEEAVAPLAARYREIRSHLSRRSERDARHRKAIAERDETELLMIEAERATINSLYRDGKLKDEGRRHIERALDLREAEIANQQAEE